MRLDRPLHTQEGEFGVYGRYASFATHQGLQHSFYALYFGGLEPTRGGKPAPQEVHSFLRQRLFCYLQQPTESAFRDYYHGSDTRATYQAKKWVIDPKDPWYTIEMDVQTQAVTARYRVGAGDWLNLGPSPLRHRESYPSLAQSWFPDLAGIPPERWVGSALGVYVRHAVCTVQQLEVHVEPNEARD
jgi:hypothetical protein